MTLIELMIVLAILSLTSEAVFSLLYAGLKTYWKGDAASQAQQGARIAVDRMIRDLRGAGQLINGTTQTVGATSVTFNTSCSEISMVLPHFATVALTPTGSIFATDAETSSMPNPGTLPYAGTYVAYYLSAASNSATANTTGPYLIRASYDLVANTITVSNVATNITSLQFTAGGSCATTASRSFTMVVTAAQTQTGQNVSSSATVTGDVTLRNSTLTY